MTSKLTVFLPQGHEDEMALGPFPRPQSSLGKYVLSPKKLNPSPSAS